MENSISYQEDLAESLSKSFINFKKTSKDRRTIPYIEARIEIIDKIWDSFYANHKQIVANVTKEERKVLPYFIEDVQGTFMEEFTTYKGKLKEELKKGLPPLDSVPKSHISEVKLPQIELPTFTGDYEEWQSFHDMFKSLIHTSTHLSPVQKLHYLKASLKGEPENLLKNLTTTESNYEEAWEQLNKRYNNKRYNANAILKKLFLQRGLTSESANGVKTLLDTTTSCLKALSNLCIPTDTWDAMIVYLVVSKLDTESHRLWQIQVSQHSVDELSSWTSLIEFLESRFRSLEMIDKKPINKTTITSNKPIPRQTTFHTTTQEIDTNHKKEYKACICCSGPHLLHLCKEFQQRSPEERIEFIKSKRICFNCFASSHTVNKCQRSTCCRRCGRRHHSLLHLEKGQNLLNNNPQLKYSTNHTNEQPEPKHESLVANFAKRESKNHEVLLATAIVKAKTRNECTHLLRALIDQGSQASFISESTAQLLGLKRIVVKGEVSGLGDGKTTFKNKVKLNIISCHSSYTTQVNAYVLKSLTSCIPSARIIRDDLLDIKSITLADPKYDKPGRIDILLGAEVYGDILLEGVIRNTPGGPIAQNTEFGWIVSGRVKEASHMPANPISLFVSCREDELLKRFWELEAEPDNILQKKLTTNEQKCEELFEMTTIRNQEGRYVVRLPFEDNDPECLYSNSKTIAIKRFNLLEKRLMKNQTLYANYKSVIDEYLNLNHMEEITDVKEIEDERCVYLPHHPVIREDRDTTKLRVVFDASCKGNNNISLNDNLLIGPKLQQDLRHILIRWRCHKIAIVSDIVKMYRQVSVCKEDTKYQRILWRPSAEETIKHHRLLTLTFGTAAAPYLAVKSLQQLAKDECKGFPTASKITLTDF